jgi:CRISPR-associated protein Csb2
MFAIAIELLTGRYTAMRFNDRTEPEWPPHPARLFSAMVAAWADNDDPDPAERSALEWLEQQDPPVIYCGETGPREVVTHFVPVNDATALTRDLSRTYALIADAHRAAAEAERSGDGPAVRRARAGLVRAEAKAARDAAAAGRLTGRESSTVAAEVLGVLPERRGKQARSYPTVVPEQTTVWFAWPDAGPSEVHRRALDQVLGRVGRIGHSSTFVACRSADTSPQPTWAPSREATQLRLRVPRAGLLGRLERAHAAHRGSEPRTLPAGMTGYLSARGQQPPGPATPLLGGDWYVLGIERRPPAAVQALAVARASRNALMAHGDQPPAEFMSGHRRLPVDGDRATSPVERPHLAVVPLPSVGHRYSDGAIFGIALILPTAQHCSEQDRSAVERALQAWSDARFELLIPSGRTRQPTRLVLADFGTERADPGPSWLDVTLASRRRTTTRDYWCRPARRWITATPIALDRFPGNLRSPHPQVRDRAETEAAASVARACAFAGLAKEPDLVSVTIRLDSPLAGVPAVPNGSQVHGIQRYPVYMSGNGTPRVCVHAEIEFERPVRGPVLVGAGRYFGYGLCLPADERPGRHGG